MGKNRRKRKKKDESGSGDGEDDCEESEKRKPKQSFKRKNNKRSRSNSYDSDDYESDDIPFADLDESTYYEEDAMLEEILDIEEEIEIGADSVENIEEMKNEHIEDFTIEDNDLEINTINKFDQILDNDLKKIRKEDKQKANEGQMYHTQLINNHAKELRVETKDEVKMNVDEGLEMADDAENVKLMIEPLNPKDNSPPCASTSISKACQVTKTPVKILTQVAVKMILNEKTGNMQIIPVKEDNDLKKTKKEKQKANERQIYDTQLLIDRHAKKIRVETIESGITKRKTVVEEIPDVDTQLIVSEAVNLKTETDIKETKGEVKLNIDEEPEMADDDKMMTNVINQKENSPPSASTNISNSTLEKILTQTAVKMILNEKTGNIQIKPVKKFETKPIIGNQCNFQDEKTETNKWNINDTVLIRYYIKKNWKYYIGTIEKIDNNNKSYKINYFKHIRQKGNLKFTKPKITKDIDIVPQDCIVKHVKLLQISKERQEFVLANEENTHYF